MAEAEDVITDVARHATVYARDLWRRHRAADGRPPAVSLLDVAQRVDLFIAAVFGRNYPLRVAQPPAPATFLTKVFRRGEGPRRTWALPATDGTHIWLPATLGIRDADVAAERYRMLALQQAVRAERGSASLISRIESQPLQDVYLLLEAYAAEEELARLLPGVAGLLNGLRQAVLARRPALAAFPAPARALETLVRTFLQRECGRPLADVKPPKTPAESLAVARTLAANFTASTPDARNKNRELLLKDWWTGELRAPALPELRINSTDAAPDPSDNAPLRSARLTRSPKVRDPGDDEHDQQQGAWMIQTAQPHEQAEDPVGLQRPTDRDHDTAAEEYADALSELTEARLVSTPGRPKEVLLTDDAPPGRAQRDIGAAANGAHLDYPEWDYRIGAYRDPGATVRLLHPRSGPQEWVERMLVEHRSMLDIVRRRFEMLRAQRARLRKQLDGEEVDLEAYIDSYADFRAGQSMAQRLYQTHRPARRNMAIMLVIDVSGSTDSWISAHRRVIDVEREALLLVCIALQGMGEPYAVIAFSGEGPRSVTAHGVKRFDEPYGDEIARRIAALEPEHYTRAGAAIRHATASLMREPAFHRLLLLLSDGKPNDIDGYEGRYGVEDMRQAVTEAKLQGIFPFCLTIDRQAANYLPAIFGAHQYATMPQPELLPTVLLDWMKRLVAV